MKDTWFHAVCSSCRKRVELLHDPRTGDWFLVTHQTLYGACHGSRAIITPEGLQVPR